MMFAMIREAMNTRILGLNSFIHPSFRLMRYVLGLMLVDTSDNFFVGIKLFPYRYLNLELVCRALVH